ncbi:hypothetical protein BDR04DRAFT_1012145, partial [Suillus decipiens]
LPPGSARLQLLGNVSCINTKEPWLTYNDGLLPMVHLVFVRLLNQKVVVISSQHVADALMDKRSRIYQP